VWRSLVARRLWVAEVPGSNPGTPIADNKFRPVCHHAGMAHSAADKTEPRIVAAPAIEKRIFVVRERQVMLDEDLADLYGVETKRLIQQVKRNLKRFPGDFMFQLTKAEAEALRSQIATSNDGRGGRRYTPYVFTEQGVAMLSGVLRSDRAITVNIEIMRAFVELRRLAGSFQELQKRLDQMELDIGARLSEHDAQLRQIFEALRQLIAPPPSTKRPIGFRVRGGDE
jgi:ORF6N domain